MFWLLLTYLVIVGVGILFGYIISVVQTTHFYVSQSGVPIWRSVIYYFMNTIVVIPIFLPSIIMLYVCLGGKLAESKLSKRTIELSNDRSNRMSESMLKEPVPTTH